MGLQRIGLNDCIYRNLLTICLVEIIPCGDGLLGGTELLFSFRIHRLFRHRHVLTFEEYLRSWALLLQGMVRGWRTKAEALVTNA